MTKVIKAGATDQTVYFKLVKASDGTPYTGLVYNTASLVAYYNLNRAAAVQITLATQTAAGAHSDGGFVEVSSTGEPGVYRLDLPDAACATGPDVRVTISGASDLLGETKEIPLVAYDVTDGVRLGLTALPNAAPDAAGGLVISDAGGLDIDTLNSNVSAILSDTGTDGVVLSTATNNAIADAILDRSNGIETGYTPRQAIRVIAASAAGKLSGAATTSIIIRDITDTKDRITATVDASGNRTAVTLDGT